MILDLSQVTMINEAFMFRCFQGFATQKHCLSDGPNVPVT